MKDNIKELYRIIEAFKAPICLYDTPLSNLESYSDQIVCLVTDKGTENEGNIYVYQYEGKIWHEKKNNYLYINDGDLRDVITFENILNNIKEFDKYYLQFKGLMSQLEKYDNIRLNILDKEKIIKRAISTNNKYDLVEIKKSLELLSDVVE